MNRDMMMYFQVYLKKNPNFCDSSVPTLCHSMDFIALRLLCPWDSPNKNTGVGSYYILLGIFPTPGIQPRSPALQVFWIFYFLSHQGSPFPYCTCLIALLCYQRRSDGPSSSFPVFCQCYEGLRHGCAILLLFFKTTQFKAKSFLVFLKDSSQIPIFCFSCHYSNSGPHHFIGITKKSF